MACVSVTPSLSPDNIFNLPPASLSHFMDGLFDEFKSSPPSVLTLHLPGCSPTLEPCGGPAEGASSPLNPPSLPACKYHGRGEEGTSIQLRYPSDSFNYFLPVVNWCQSVQPQKPSEDISYFTCVHI